MTCMENGGQIARNHGGKTEYVRAQSGSPPQPRPPNGDACTMLSSMEVVKRQFPRQISQNLAVRTGFKFWKIVRKHKDKTIKKCLQIINYIKKLKIKK